MEFGFAGPCRGIPPVTYCHHRLTGTLGNPIRNPWIGLTGHSWYTTRMSYGDTPLGGGEGAFAERTQAQGVAETNRMMEPA